MADFASYDLAMSDAPDLVGYLLRITPALLVVSLLYIVLRGKQALPFRIAVIIIGFLIVRDTLILYGVWGYGVTHGWLPWVRFIEDPILVVLFAVGSILTTAFLVMIERDGRSLLVWGKFKLSHLGWGLAGGIVLAGALVAADQLYPLAERGGPVPGRMLLPLILVAIFGNLTEDILVRGYVQGYLTTIYSPWRAAIGSALFFALGHVFLVTLVTDLGTPVLVYAFIDGLVCAVVRMKSGLIPAALSHGMAIIVLATGLI